MLTLFGAAAVGASNVYVQSVVQRSRIDAQRILADPSAGAIGDVTGELTKIANAALWIGAVALLTLVVVAIWLVAAVRVEPEPQAPSSSYPEGATPAAPADREDVRSRYHVAAQSERRGPFRV